MKRIIDFYFNHTIFCNIILIIAIYFCAKYGDRYYENYNDKFIFKNKGYVWNLNSDYHYLNYFKKNTEIKISICNKFNSFTEITFPRDCWVEDSYVNLLKKVWPLKRNNLLEDVKHSLTKQKNIKIIGEVTEKNKSNEDQFDIEATAGQIFKGKYFYVFKKDDDGEGLILTKENLYLQAFNTSKYFDIDEYGNYSIFNSENFDKYFRADFVKDLDKPFTFSVQKMLDRIEEDYPVGRDSFSKTDSEAYQKICKMGNLRLDTIKLCYHTVYWKFEKHEYGCCKFLILKLENTEMEKSDKLRLEN
jgi:hypothetical protein